MRFTKKQKSINSDIKPGHLFKLKDALEVLKKHTSKKFDESVDLSVSLGIDAKKSDQQVRGVLSLPKMPEKKLELLFLLKAMMQKRQRKMVQMLLAQMILLN